jgi:drug/metabolite transporter (DMT)-like permease
VLVSSTIFLKKRLKLVQWGGIAVVVSGLVVVGVSDLIYDKKSQGTHTDGEKVLGIALILLGMVFTSLQVGQQTVEPSTSISSIKVVYEERFIGKYNIPALQAVGWEGIFGFFTLGLLLIPVNTNSCYTNEYIERFSHFD